MTTTDFTRTLLVDRSPEQVFQAIKNIRGWWSEDVEGSTEALNEEFYYKFRDVHQCRMKVVEFLPGKKVVWQVLENHFSFTQDKSEWVNTRIVFDISPKGEKTELRFTHEGLTPAYECFEICNDAWSTYIQNSLHNLITAGKGEPNPKEGGFNEWLLGKHMDKSQTGSQTDDFSVAFLVKVPAAEAFERILDVPAWWTPDIKGDSLTLHAVFTVEFGDVHVSTQKVTEFIPGKKLVWLVTESRLNFISNEQEWTGTRIVFELKETKEGVEVRFTHIGLHSGIECYEACSGAWTTFIKGSLANLIHTGVGQAGF